MGARLLRHRDAHGVKLVHCLVRKVRGRPWNVWLPRRPGDVQAATEIAICRRSREMLGRVLDREPDQEHLDIDDLRGIVKCVAYAMPCALGRLCRSALAMCWGGTRRFLRSPAGDTGRSQDLIRLRHDPERPGITASIGMVPLGLLAVGVANLLETRVLRHTEHFIRVDRETVWHEMLTC